MGTKGILYCPWLDSAGSGHTERTPVGRYMRYFALWWEGNFLKLGKNSFFAEKILE